MQHLVQSIGTVSSPYTQKFGIPRQPQLVAQAKICITLNAEFSADCVRGLDGFEYIWVQFLFHDAVQEGWAEMVRPPRLGGKKKNGRVCHAKPAPAEPFGFVAAAAGTCGTCQRAGADLVFGR